MKYIILCIIFCLLAGCSTGTTTVQQSVPTRKMEAQFTVEQWFTNEVEGNWVVNVFFEMRNTGNVQIAYYEVYFDIICEDGSKYTGDGWGPSESLGQSYEGAIADPVYPGGTNRGLGGYAECKSKPVKVTVKNWKLYQYK